MGAPTEYYVDPAIAGNSGSGTIGDPYGDLQYALDQVGGGPGRDALNGDRFNIKAGTDEILTGALSFVAYGAPSFSAPCIIQGYTAVSADGGIGGIDGNGNSVISGSSLSYVHFIDMHLHNSGANSILALDNGSVLVNCEIDNTTGHGIEGDQNTMVVGCYIHNCGDRGATVSNNSFVLYCTFENGANDFSTAIYLEGSGASAMFNIIDIDGASDGIFCNGLSGMIAYHSIYSNGGTGTGIVASQSYQVVVGNICEGFSGVGGIGIQLDTDMFLVYGTNAFYNNATNLVDNSELILADYSANDQNLTPGGVSPFIDAPNDDFRVNTLVRALAYPTDDYPNLPAGVRSFLDIGVLQREESPPAPLMRGRNTLLRR